MKRILAVALLWLFSACTSQIHAGDNWPRFRGENGAGISDATTIPVEWSADDYAWIAELPGVGHSSPVVWDDSVFLTSADQDASERYLLAIDAGSGKERWRKTYPFESFKKHGNNSFATNTPCCDATHVYVLWQAQGEVATLHAYTHDGAEKWKAELGTFKGGHGPAVSPIVHDGLVVIANDLDANSSLMAFDAATGERRWLIPRSSTRVSYSTPCVFQPKSRPPELIFTDMHHGITAVDPKAGTVNWEISVFGTFKQRAIASPVVTEDLVIGSSGFTTAEKNIVAVRPASTNVGQVEAKEIYRISKSVPHIPSPLIYKDRLFLWTDRGGIVTCADVNSGEIIWQKRIGGNFSGSPICVDGKIYCADDDGTVYVVAAADEFKVLAENSLDKPTRATPAVAGGKIFFRTYSHLIAIQ